MKLQKRLSRIYNGKKYYKYLIVIPSEDIEKSDFKEGDELRINSKKDSIKISKS